MNIISYLFGVTISSADYISCYFSMLAKFSLFHLLLAFYSLFKSNDSEQWDKVIGISIILPLAFIHSRYKN